MITIYKKLPKTNCGRCGESTCMAFAMNVKKSQASLSECPFFPSEKSREGPPAAEISSCSSYAQVSQDLERAAVGVDFEEAGAAIGGENKTADGREAIVLKMIRTEYELRKEGLFLNDEYCRDIWARIIICDYVRRQGVMPLTGEWIPLGLFPHTASLVKTFQRNAEREIAASFRRDLVRLKQRCAELGGREAEGRVKADYICQFNLLPAVPVHLSFWAADEEFDADCKLLFDSNAENHIDIEYLAYLVERFASDLARS